MTILRSSIRRWLVLVFLLSITSKLQAQHYPAGSEGLKGASMPPPGLYAEDYNSFYYSDRTPGFQGQLEHTWEYAPESYPYIKMKPGFDLFTYVQAPRLLWITDWKLLGADFGMAVKIPFVYKKHDQGVPTILEKYAGIPFGPSVTSVNQSGLGDIQVEPLILSWHLKRFDIVAGYSFWAPSGEYDHHKLFLLNLGNGYWTHMLTLGVTWYPDAEKTWAISLLNRYEINTAQYSDLYNVPVSPSTPLGIGALSTTLGDIYTLEWAVSKTVAKGVDIGLTGYYQQQVTPTEGPTWYGPTYFGERVHVAGIGPEINVNFSKWGLSALLRYAYEFAAMDHPQGHLLNVTLIKSF